MFAENEFKKSCFCFKILFWDSNSIVIEKKTVISPFVSPFLKQYLSSRKPQYRGSSRSETSLMPSSIRWDVCHPVGEFHPIYACHHWSHISVHVSPGSVSLDNFYAIDRNTGSDLTFWCHQYHGKLRDSIYVTAQTPSAVSASPSPLRGSLWVDDLPALKFTKLSEDLQTIQTYSWDLESKVSLSGAAILIASYLSASREEFLDLGIKEKQSLSFLGLPEVLAGCLMSQICRN